MICNSVRPKLTATPHGKLSVLRYDSPRLLLNSLLSNCGQRQHESIFDDEAVQRGFMHHVLMESRPRQRANQDRQAIDRQRCQDQLLRDREAVARAMRFVDESQCIADCYPDLTIVPDDLVARCDQSSEMCVGGGS